MKYYVLTQDRLPIPCDELFEWAIWLEENTAARRVGLDEIGEHRVSTVFLGLDHNFCPTGDPLLFETMVFTPDDTGTMQRYTSWAQAAAGHERIASMLRRELADAGEVTCETLRKALVKAKAQA